MAVYGARRKKIPNGGVTSVVEGKVLFSEPLKEAVPAA
jgi:hypothetical protein